MLKIRIRQQFEQTTIFAADILCTVDDFCKQFRSTARLVNRDFIDKMVSKIDSFWKFHCLPELLTHSLYDKASDVHQVATKVPLFCYCQKPWDENDGTDMIGCDNTNCTFKWIHLQCAKLKRAKKGSWYCKDCRKMKK